MKEKIDFPATNSTPLVKYTDDRKLIIKGRSISENEITFYSPIISWASSVQTNLLEVEANLEYINSRCSKKLFLLFRAMDENLKISKLIIHWYYDDGDEDALLKGNVYAESLSRAEFYYHKNT